MDNAKSDQWLKVPPIQADSRQGIFHKLKPLPPCNQAGRAGRRGGAPGRECLGGGWSIGQLVGHVLIIVRIFLKALFVTLALATSGGGGCGG